MNWNNKLAGLLKIDYPLIQAPMLGITTPEMVAAAAGCGVLGSLPVGGLSPGRSAELIRQTQKLTGKPFAVNLFTYEIPAMADATTIKAMQAYLHLLAADNSLEYEDKSVASFQHHDYKEQISVLLEEGISRVSFTFGIPDDASIHTLKENGILLIGTATSVAEALLLQAKGVDVIVAQGIEAGGHRGTFLETGHLPAIGSMSLIPQIVDAVHCPVVAAGGIKDGRTVKAAMTLGAQGVQIGSALLASNESLAIPAFKAMLQEVPDTGTRLTRSFSGRWARGISNAFMDALDESRLDIPAYPWQNSLTTAFRAAATKQDHKDLVNLWAGQSAGGAEQQPVAAILQQIIRETEDITVG